MNVFVTQRDEAIGRFIKAALGERDKRLSLVVVTQFLEIPEEGSEWLDAMQLDFDLGKSGRGSVHIKQSFDLALLDYNVYHTAELVRLLSPDTLVLGLSEDYAPSDGQRRLFEAGVPFALASKPDLGRALSGKLAVDRYRWAPRFSTTQSCVDFLNRFYKLLGVGPKEE